MTMAELCEEIQNAILQARAEACAIACYELDTEVKAPPVVLVTHDGDVCDVP